MTAAVEANLSPSMRYVVREPPAERTSTSQLVERLLHDHGAYARGIRDVAWPARQREIPMQEWVDLLARLYPPGQTLHGRHAILGAALLDPPSGRRMVECGLARAIAGQLSQPWARLLSDRGRERLAAIPLLCADAGIEGPVDAVKGVVGTPAFDPEGGRLAVWLADRGPVVYDRDLRVVGSLEGRPSGDVLAWSADGEHLYVADGDTLVRTPAPPGEGDAVRVPAGSEIRAILVDPRAEWVATLGGGEIRRWSPALDGEPQTLAEDQAHAAMDDTGDGVVFADASGALTWWRPRDDDPPKRLLWQPKGVSTVLALDGGRLLARSAADEVILWQGGSDTVLPVGKPVREIGWLPGTDEVLVATPEHIEVAGLDGPRRVLDGTAPMAAAAGHQRLATCAPGGRVRLWNPMDGALLAEFDVGGDPIGLAFSPDGSRLAVTTPSSIRLVDTGLIRRQPHVLAEYAADTAAAEADLLGIDRDVDAFAALVAARSVVPPLSIALFGEWGAGKSFFMRRMRGVVDELSRESRESGAPQQELEFHKRIAQVEFNAWHYADGNLWASLVDHLLANLRIDPDEPQGMVERRRARVLEEIAARRADAVDAEHKQREADRLREEAEQAVDAAKAEERDLDQRLAEASRATPDVVLPSGAEAAARAALETVRIVPMGDAAANLADALGEARDRLEREGAGASLHHAPDASTRWRTLIKLLAAGPLAGLVVGTVLVLLAPDAVGLLAGAATGIGIVLNRGADWVRTQLAWRDKQLAEVDRARRAVLRPLEEARREQAERIADLERELALARQAVGEAEDERIRKTARVDRLEQELAAITPAGLLSELVASRIASEDYSRQLGIVALVRRDFEAMSELLGSHAARVEAGGAGAEEELGIGRIVLYIDDLDRCPPRKVVQVLEAIHLLLAFPLFVVVVGVDARWLTRSLAMRHPHLLAIAEGTNGTGDAATPWDYLEKIFQVPFWLEPLDQGATRRMLRGLLPGAAASVPAARPGPRERPAGDPPADPGSPAGAPPAEGGGGGPAPAGGPAPRDLHPESLEMTPYELSVMEHLAPLLGRSPRALKRFVNTYRLVKARLGDPVGFNAPRTPLRHDDAVMLLLAVTTGFPRMGPRLLDALLTPTAGPRTLRRHVELLAGDDDPAVAREARTVLRWCDDKAAGSWPTVDGARLRRWADEVARFSFRADAPREGIETP